jgi:nitrate reductase gamma subunit
MPLIHTVPLLLGALAGLLLSLITWGLWQVRRHATEDNSIETHDSMLLALLILAAFSFGAFMIYFLLSNANL